jgi:hypothetical protein
LVEKITKKNTFRPYPDINDVPNWLWSLKKLI